MRRDGAPTNRWSSPRGSAATGLLFLMVVGSFACSVPHDPLTDAGRRLAQDIEMARARSVQTNLEHRIARQGGSSGWHVQEGDRPFQSVDWTAEIDAVDLTREYAGVTLLQWPGDIRFHPDGQVVSLGPVILGTPGGAQQLRVSVSRLGRVRVSRPEEDLES